MSRKYTTDSLRRIAQRMIFLVLTLIAVVTMFDIRADLFFTPLMAMLCALVCFGIAIRIVEGFRNLRNRANREA